MRLVNAYFLCVQWAAGPPHAGASRGARAVACRIFGGHVSAGIYKQLHAVDEPPNLQPAAGRAMQRGVPVLPKRGAWGRRQHCKASAHSVRTAKGARRQRCAWKAQNRRCIVALSAALLACGVERTFVLASTEAPAAISSSIVSMLPQAAALCRAVLPNLSAACTTAWASSQCQHTQDCIHHFFDRFD